MNAVVYGIFALIAPRIVTLFYGEDYINIVLFVRILAIIVYFRSISGLVGVLSITKGRTDIDFYWNLLLIVILPIVIGIGVNYGIFQIIIFMAFTQAILMIPAWFMFYKRFLNIDFVIYFKAIFFPFLLASVVYLIYAAININSLLVQIFMSFLLIITTFIYTLKTEVEWNDLVKRNWKYYVRFFSGDK